MNRRTLVIRQTLIELACDGDYRTLASGYSKASTLTVAEALEVLE